ncbi:sensor histidine kinase [Acidisphaera sp. L21]|uniref:sensor histidine kinase n=1 Tax=Acidisphaera sp. L21 TaxID=1641851 RepID=UPI00131B10A7|nr:histidine kinase dimerization/phosphoacceptor domain -containing protein [Acidisphaera sp. L21]
MSRAAEPRSVAEIELTVRLQQQELVASFGMFAFRGAELDSVLDQACEVAAKGLNTAYSKVLEYRPTTQDFLLRNGVGWREGVVGRVALGADLASPAGFALRTKMPVVSNHLTQEARFRTPAVLAEHGIHRAINVIIEVEGSLPFGVLEADSSDRYQFTVHDLSFMQALANILSAAITRQRQSVVQQELLQQKDMLMQEVHHRVKNNLQLVHTMLHLQARGIPDGSEKSRLQEAASRIMSIAAVHRRLHEEGAVERVELASYLEGLMADMSESLGAAMAERPIALDVDPMKLPSEHVTPVGLITVEMITNALKYGAGAIAVRVRKTDLGVDISVQDDGAGFPDDYKPGSGASLGMRLIAALARSRDAISVGRTEGGTIVTVRVSFSQAKSP